MTHPTIDLSRTGIPLYVQLSTLFRRRIETGAWGVGQQIPTLDDLVAEFGVARETVRRALMMLESQDLLSRQRGRGTFVQNRPTASTWYGVETDWDSLIRSHESTRFDMLSESANVPPPRFAHEIGTPVDNYFYMRRRHWKGDAPYLIGDVFLDPRILTQVPRKTLLNNSTLKILLQIPGLEVAHAQQTLVIGTADTETARLLDVSINAPTAVVHRTFVDDAGDIIAVTAGTYRGESIRLDMKLR